MRILFLTSSMHAGGAERVASTLANAWAQRGDDVTLMPTFSGGGTCFYPLSEKVKLVFLANLLPARIGASTGKLVRLRGLRRFMVSHRPDVVVSFLSNVNVAAVVASFGLHIPLIVCERVDPFATQDIGWPLRTACRLAYPLADALMVQTHAVARRYASTRWLLPPVRVIPNPVPGELLEFRRVGRTDGGKILVAVGRLVEQKQFDKLIRCFAGLAKEYWNWTLRIAGEGHLRPALEKQVAALGMGQRIELMGQVQDVGGFLAQADAFVLTSAFEGFPNALLEAMASGLPCVCFDCPSGPREMSLDGEVALLVPLNDESALTQALAQVMGDSALRMSLGRLAQDSIAQRYSLATVLSLWDALFDKLKIDRLSLVS